MDFQTVESQSFAGDFVFPEDYASVDVDDIGLFEDDILAKVN